MLKTFLAAGLINLTNMLQNVRRVKTTYVRIQFIPCINHTRHKRALETFKSARHCIKQICVSMRISY